MIELLKNVRVLECTVLPTGDQAGRFLGDLGAQSIKVEQPGIGDYIRDLGDMMAPRHSTTHMLINRHKRSITLNLRSDAGREVFYKILPTIDIFVDGFAGDACERLGVGYEAQRKVKPDIIYCQTNGFGTRGPYGQIPVHGYMMGATAGSTQLRVREDGLVEEVVEPTDLNFPGYVDGPLLGGLFGAFTAIAALNYRNATGKGCYIDSSGTDATLAAQSLDASSVWNRDRTERGINLPPTVGQDPAERPKYAFYVTKDDKFVLLAAIEHKFWDNFCDVIERPDLREMKYLDSPVDFRNKGGDKNLAHILRPIMADRTLAEWMDIATKYDIPLSPANSVQDTLQDPHLRAREIIHESVHPVAGAFTTVGWPSPVDGQPFDVERHAPTLGQHTNEILAEVGYSADDINELREQGIV